MRQLLAVVCLSALSSALAMTVALAENRVSTPDAYQRAVHDAPTSWRRALKQKAGE